MSTAQLERKVDREALVAALLFEGLEIRELAGRFGVSQVQIRAELDKEPTRKLMEQASSKRLELVARIPIANQATRLRRLEEIYKSASLFGDGEMQLKTLAAARDEEKLGSGGTGIGGLQVNITNFIGSRDAAKDVREADREARTERRVRETAEAVFSEVEQTLREDAASAPDAPESQE